MRSDFSLNHDYFVGTQNSVYFTVDEGKGRLNPSREKIQGKHRTRKVDEKSCATLLLWDPGWCVHKSDVQKKWDDNIHNTLIVLPSEKQKMSAYVYYRITIAWKIEYLFWYIQALCLFLLPFIYLVNYNVYKYFITVLEY